MTIQSRNGLLAGALGLVAIVGGAAWYHAEHNSPAAAVVPYNAAAPNAAPLTDPNYNNTNGNAYGAAQSNNNGYAANGTSANGYSSGVYNNRAASSNDVPGTYATDNSRRVYTSANAGYNSGNYVTNDRVSGGYAGSTGYSSATPEFTEHYVQTIRRPVRVYYPPAQNTYVENTTGETVYENQPVERTVYNDRPRAYNNGYVERTTVYDRHHHRSTKKSIAIVAGSAAGGAAIGALAGGGKGAGIGALAGGGAGFIYDRLTHNR